MNAWVRPVPSKPGSPDTRLEIEAQRYPHLLALEQSVRQFLLPLVRELLKATAYDTPTPAHERYAVGIETVLEWLEEPEEHLFARQREMLDLLDGYRCDCGGAFHRDAQYILMVCSGCAASFSYSDFLALIQRDGTRRAKAQAPRRRRPTIHSHP